MQNVKNGLLHVSIAVAMLWAAVFNVIPINIDSNLESICH